MSHGILSVHLQLGSGEILTAILPHLIYFFFLSSPLLFPPLPGSFRLMRKKMGGAAD